MPRSLAAFVAAVAVLAGCDLNPLYPPVDHGDGTTTQADTAVADVPLVVDVVPGKDVTAVDAAADATPLVDAVADAAGDADAADDADAAVDAGLDIPGGATNIDLISVDWSCKDPQWKPKVCNPGMIFAPPILPGIHVDLPTPITYADAPPSSGTHRPVWAKWGEYAFLPQQRWLHNLEHGGMAFLYHPCAPQGMVDLLRAFAESQPDDAGGPFRWVMTPYPNLQTAVAMLGWGHVYLAECVKPLDMKQYVPVFYRHGNEDEPFDGAYDTLWIGK